MKKLAPKGRELRRQGAGYGIFSPRSRRALVMIDPQDIEVAQSAHWLMVQGEGLALSAKGRAQLAKIGKETVTVDILDDQGRWAKAQRKPDFGVLSRYYSPSTPATTLLNRVQFEAGERLHGDYYRSSLAPSITQNWQSFGAGRSPTYAASDPGEGALAAKSRVMRALEAVGPKLDQILIAMVIRELSLEGAERHLSWPRHAARFALPLALDRLAHHYGLITPQRASAF
ncbi:DUF6456 domain-containing protein [Woodsholea maritima]|uniref:DUF6456 domain-containing protein n=1 Tax=Woodsholea maritima TaxID=240237 RepID=UPI0012E9B251|nr:DUF6456 domain-containing protein [Woodsholea maritima]